MSRSRRRRQGRGCAWHWKQTDCWYYTPPNTRQRVALVDEQGQRIRGSENKQAADLALARLKVSGQLHDAPAPTASVEDWLVAREKEGAPAGVACSVHAGRGFTNR